MVNSKAVQLPHWNLRYLGCTCTVVQETTGTDWPDCVTIHVPAGGPPGPSMSMVIPLSDTIITDYWIAALKDWLSFCQFCQFCQFCHLLGNHNLQLLTSSLYSHNQCPHIHSSHRLLCSASHIFLFLRLRHSWLSRCSVSRCFVQNKYTIGCYAFHNRQTWST